MPDVSSEGRSHMVQKFYRRREVEQLTGLPTSTLYDEMRQGRFPKPIKLGARTVAWLESDIAKWQKATIDAARREPEAA
jgi:prophage regulatory protein